MKLREQKFNRLQWLSISLVTLLTACGGSSETDSTNDTSVTLSGSVFASAVNGASCEVKDNSNQVAGSFTTSTNGDYSISLPSDQVAKNFTITCSGGTFTDEATGQSNSIAGTMAAYIAGGTSSMDTTIHITPASTIVHDLINQHGKTATEASTIFKAAFGFSPDLSIAPVDATNPAGATDNAGLLSGLRAATFSQLASDLGLSSADQFALFAALAEDLSDGSLDGQGASGAINAAGITLPADIQNRFSQALINFRSGTRDASGLANNKIGIPPFAKVAITDNYRVEYLPDMQGAVNGKTAFTLKVSDPNGTLQTGLDISIQPKMNMAGKAHTAPFQATCSEGMSLGEYGCTVYYLMPSVMMNGMSMGFWELKVMIGDQESDQAIFYPTVTMAMGDTVQVRLKGQEDKIASSMKHGQNMMDNTENRTYFLFKNSLTGMDNNHTFEIFIAAKESMMSFPGVFTGATLSAGDIRHELSLTTLSVNVSSDAVNWVNATEKEGQPGHWVASGISGLTQGTTGTLYVQLDVEGEQKTTDGNVPNDLPAADDANNHYAKFRVTPGNTGMSM